MSWKNSLLRVFVLSSLAASNLSVDALSQSAQKPLSGVAGSVKAAVGNAAANHTTMSHKVSKHHARHSVANHNGGRSYGRSALVPPPPAFMPAILPELTARHMRGDDDAANDDADKPENPYKKYVHTPEGNAPAPLQTRKGVVIWAQRG
jgi:hypothetical protein